ncbi:hypothetical protein EZV62_004561 [Acer yangbiense]|uniref:Uncharacterized protein n=1 Tax=Acer yangbiense TaxID=1000413 RepID=A0A5C7IMD5_9ROSI|nr:hypothetical protein EZV62_004561 [Acer yangbiense]
MVVFSLKIKASLIGFTALEPFAGTDDPDFPYYFKLLCTKCQSLSDNELCFMLNGASKVSYQCRYCGARGTVSMLPDYGEPHTHKHSLKNEPTTLMLFNCQGFEPSDFVFAGGWKATAENVVCEDVNLSAGQFVISNEDKPDHRIFKLEAFFKVVPPRFLQR